MTLHRHRIRLVSAWQRVDSLGTHDRVALPDRVALSAATYVRRFNPPTSLGKSDRVDLVGDHLLGRLSAATLGGQRLPVGDESSFRIDITAFLAPHNELSLTFFSLDGAVGIMGEVYLEIESPADG